MTLRLHSHKQLYRNVAELWHTAGAKPLDCLEVLLEMLVLAGPEKEQWSDSVDLGQSDMTRGAWAEHRHRLARKLELPDQRWDELERVADRTPGLVERTYRAVVDMAPVSSPASLRSYVNELLQYLVHAPQTGLRGTELGGFPWPDYFIPLFTAFLGRAQTDPVYVPFDSSGWLPLLLAAAGWPVNCEVSHPQIARIILLFAFLGDWKLSVRLGDPIRRPAWLDGSRLHRFSWSAAIVSFGPRTKDQPDFDAFDRFPVRLLYREGQQVAHLVAQTKGRVVVIVPEGLLFRTTGGDRDYKEYLIRHGLLAAIVRLPRNAFAPYANVQTSMLLLDTDGRLNREVFFLDTTDRLSGNASSKGRENSPDDVIEQIVEVIRRHRITPISAIASYDEIATREFNISVDRYVRSEEEQRAERVLEAVKTVEIADIAEIIRPQSFPSAQAELGPAFAEVGLQDIRLDGAITQPTKLVKIADRSFGKIIRQTLEPGDVLLSIRGRIGAVGIVADIETKEGIAGWLASQAFVILRLRGTSPIRPLTLYRYLASPLGQGLLQSLSTGTAVPMIAIGDIKKFKVIVPTAAEQNEIELRHQELRKIREKIVRLESQANQINASSWPMTREPEPKRTSPE